jgi:hypothetical protein
MSQTKAYSIKNAYRISTEIFLFLLPTLQVVKL